MKIEHSGIYHYDEEYLFENGVKTVRLAIIDAVTNLIINDQLIYQEDFDKEFIEIFLKYSLEGLPKKILITDGHPAYPAIIERICIKQQLCIFHIIKNHHDKSFKKINKLERRIKTLETKIQENNAEIKEIREFSKGKSNILNEDEKLRKRKIKRRKKLDKQNKKFRKELREKRKELKELKSINERIENIHDHEDQKGAMRRFKTIYTQIKQFDDDTQKFLKNLDKKFDKTIEFYNNPHILRTINKIEGYFNITLPKTMKRKFRTRDGLIRWIRLQKIRWTERNVLTQKNMKIKTNIQKINSAS